MQPSEYNENEKEIHSRKWKRDASREMKKRCIQGNEKKMHSRK